MSLFKEHSQEELEMKQKKRGEKSELLQRIAEANKKLRSMDRFPGSLEEYNQFKGEEYVIMDTGTTRKYLSNLPIYGDIKLDDGKLALLEQMEALIRYTETSAGADLGYSIPVKRKEIEE